MPPGATVLHLGVTCLGFDTAYVAAVEEELASRGPQGGSAAGAGSGERARVLCLGPQASAARLGGLLADAGRTDGGDRPRWIIACGHAAEHLGEIGGGTRLFYASPAPLSPGDLAVLIEASLAAPAHAPGPSRAPPGAEELMPAGTAAKLAALARSLVLEHGDHTARVPIEDCCRSLLNAEEARLVIFAEAAGRTAGPDGSHGGEIPRQAQRTSGLTGFLSRTGRPFQVDCAFRDPRYHAEVDAPLGPGEARWLLSPVHGADGSVAAALVVARHAGARSPRFSTPEVLALCSAAQQVAAHLARVRLAAASAPESAAAGSPEGATPGKRRTPFRREALEHYRSPQRGGPLSLSPRWATPTYYLLVVAALLAALASWVATVPDYADGPAILSASGANLGGGEPARRQEPRITVQALLPGRYRPRLAPGMELLFTADRFPDRELRLRVTAVGEELPGPGEARRLLGQRAANALPGGGPVVQVEASAPASLLGAGLPRTGVDDTGGDDMGGDEIGGRARVVVDEERLLLKLLPGLRGADRRRHGS